MTPNPAERERARDDSYSALQTTEASICGERVYTNCVSTFIYMDICLTKGLIVDIFSSSSSLVVDKEFPLGC